jgi:signal transduction histidine kinase
VDATFVGFLAHRRRPAAYRDLVTQGAARSNRDAAFDVAVVAAAVGIAFLDTLSPAAAVRSYGGTTFAASAAVAACLWYRRRAPLAVGSVAAVATAAMAFAELVAPGVLFREGADSAPWMPSAVPFAAYAIVAFGRRGRAAWLLLAGLAAMAVTATALAVPPPGAPWLGILTVSALFVLGPALLGSHTAARRRLLDALVDRAERAEREQHLIAERTRTEERSRLAAEMHDVVSHRVTLMVLRAGALQMTSADEAVRSAAEDLRITGSQALEELRDVVGLLRDPAADDGVGPPEPAGIPIPDLSELIAESRSVGVPVDLVEAGSPTLASPVVGRTAYRLVQEALTNVRKHAPGARVRVSLRYRPEGIRLSVYNTAATRAADTSLTGGGTGLPGLRQRVQLIGGELAAGPDGSGGFRVEATLPAYVTTGGGTGVAP